MSGVGGLWFAANDVHVAHGSADGCEQDESGKEEFHGVCLSKFIPIQRDCAVSVD